MSQDIFPEIRVATEALESRIAITEAEVAEMKDGIAGKRELFARGEKPLRPSIRSGPRPRTAQEHTNGNPPIQFFLNGTTGTFEGTFAPRRLDSRPCKVISIGLPFASTVPQNIPAPVPGYEQFIKELKERIHGAQLRAGLAVNRELILLYWSIGKDILERQRRGMGR